MEAGLAFKPGALRVMFYQPGSGYTADIPEPVQSHLKLTIIDYEWTVLGSGNLDRASMYTSQELGLAFFSPNLATTVRNSVDELMQSRQVCIYDSRPTR